ncbi:MAG: pyridoxamine 5'-phosphate oxidase family protein [Acidimicrobiales bacterium]
MSIRVEMADLPAEIVARGGGFLLSSVMDSRPHAAHLMFEVASAGGRVELRAATGRTARANCRNRPAVTVLWPAAEPGGHSLIVDGEARLDGDEHVVVSAVSAVLHRPAP